MVMTPLNRNLNTSNNTATEQLELPFKFASILMVDSGSDGGPSKTDSLELMMSLTLLSLKLHSEETPQSPLIPLKLDMEFTSKL